MKKIILALALGLIGSTHAMADSRTDQINQIIRQLDPQVSAMQEERSVSARKIEIIVRRPSDYFVTHYGTSAEFPVFFNFDSARLTEKGMIMLDALASAMRDPAISKYRYLIAGHTDAKGSWAHNLDLSERRAEAVASYLVEVGGINPARLITIGWGEERLKDASRPHAAINRRVEVSFVTNEIVNLTPGTAITVWQGQDKLIKSTITVQQIRSRFPDLEVKVQGGQATIETDSNAVTITVPQSKPALAQDDCERLRANDPRPEQHSLDDFNSGRTPLKCEEDRMPVAPVVPAPTDGLTLEGDRVTIN